MAYNIYEIYNKHMDGTLEVGFIFHSTDPRILGRGKQYGLDYMDVQWTYYDYNVNFRVAVDVPVPFSGNYYKVGDYKFIFKLKDDYIFHLISLDTKADVEALAAAEEAKRIAEEAKAEEEARIADEKKEKDIIKHYAQFDKQRAEAEAMIKKFKDRYEQAETLYNANKYKKAFPLYEALAKEGYSWAQWRLGSLYYNGEGIKENETKAAEWWKKSIEGFRRDAEIGVTEAMVGLGHCYDSNVYGLPADDEKKAEWWHKAAVLGNTEAMIFIGQCYSRGSGVPLNYKKALKWFNEAAAHGNKNAQYWIDDLKREGKI